MEVTKTNKHFVPFTHIYLVKENQILMLLRNPSKKIWPDKLLGIGGKIEPGEGLVQAAEREFYEETGAKPIGLTLKGTFSWDDDSNYSGINFIFTASGFVGELNPNSDEGALAWYDLEKLISHPKLAGHQKLYLKQILTNNFYVSHSTFEGDFNTGNIVRYDDNFTYFKDRTPI